MRIINNLLSSWIFLSKIDILILKKIFLKELAKNFPCISITSNKLNIKVYFLINFTDIAMIFAISKIKLSSKSVLKFDKKCKKIQIK